ncbi:MAG: 2Fe-2S iron-sulfur cluster binding domain-containing protein [Cyanobacteriota bacterium]|nr:2Fe-2S iron-sulfur cluster binding domain-containing protein [Cyanobacteriota bacterium]
MDIGPLMRIHWPNGATSWASPGTDWLVAARDAQITIPTGCLGGSCGACEISVNGATLRACVDVVPHCPEGALSVEFWSDPTW